ncbi:U6 snRNA phosphodiesterase 1 [Anabrus simplex]|uniref:U6 snRNA phosphodiesterase 1 n=1 Tax=Anabrus simplex TaxID=316456 RepID=UPI0035A2914F
MAATSRGALGLLNVYDSSDSENDDDVPSSRVRTKRMGKGEEFEKMKKIKTEDSHTTRLPLPPALESLFSSAIDEIDDNPELHDGRIRSFPHERGNWSTFVYIPYEPDLIFLSLADVFVECLKEIAPMKLIKDLHISLTRTVILRHHWIEPFTDSVRALVQEIPRFQLSFSSVNVYCNEEKTRTFVGLSVLTEKELLKSVSILDNCLAEFKLPEYYEDPSFHLSVAWCLGDHTKEVNSVLPQLQLVFQQFLSTHPNNWSFTVDSFMCKSGNKLLAFHLAPA